VIRPLPDKEKRLSWSDVVAALRQMPRAARLVLEGNAPAAIGIVLCGLLRALIPLAIAWVGKLVVDGVVLALETKSAADQREVLFWVAVEFGLMAATGLLTGLQGLLRSLLGARLAYLINIKILEKALTLELIHFENPEVYDKLQNARREASSRPLNLFVNGVELFGNVITLGSYGVLLLTFDWLTLLILVAATVPAFIVEARFSGEAFRLFTWRAPESRKMRYLELVMTLDSHAKEVKLYQLGEEMMRRYRGLYDTLFDEERSLAMRRSGWGFVLGLASTVALYGCYAWIVARTVAGALTLGDMTLYITVFRQGQGALRNILRAIGTTYEDNLFMSNLFAFFAITTRSGAIDPPSPPAEGRSGFVLDDVSFRYPGTDKWALEGLSLTIGPNESLAIVGENGAGKTTLIKLLCGLYRPTRGTITLDGRPLDSYPPEELRRRFGVVLQDFVRYQFSARDNVGLGLPEHLGDHARIESAAIKGGAKEPIDALPNGFDTQLGRWFEGGVELSTGNWQKVAVSRAFMREADIVILDEPTAALDAEAEHALFQRFRELTAGKTALLISHRFSTVRMADRIVVLSGGRVEELGTHATLMEKGGRYAHLFNLQAKGYLRD
jgi:ABC-type multidrug transport system fused ATPase/permease subunit